jgi:hypothetical protein
MNEVEISATERSVEKIIGMMEKENKAMENVLESFRSNNLTDCEAYQKLAEEKDDLEIGIQELEEQLDEQTDDGLAELFG